MHTHLFFKISHLNEQIHTHLGDIIKIKANYKKGEIHIILVIKA